MTTMTTTTTIPRPAETARPSTQTTPTTLFAPTTAKPSAQRPLLVLRLRGTQEEMGAQHGRVLREEGGYEETMAFYRRLPERLLLGQTTGLGAQIARTLGRGAISHLLQRLEKRRPAAYLARTRAFMKALGFPEAHARYLLVMDVFQNLVGLAGRHRLGPFSERARHAAVPACSTLMAWGRTSAGGALRHARNFDFPGTGLWDRAPVVVFCDPGEGLRYGFVTSRGVDTPGISAFNEAGLTVTAHTRFGRRVSSSGRGVVDLTHDIVRRAETIADATRIAEESTVASTWGLAVSSASERAACVIETDSAGTSIVRPAGEAEHLTCANRFRHPARVAGEVVATTSWWTHSDAREARLGRLAEEAAARGGLRGEDLARALGDHRHAEDPSGELRGGGSILSQPITVMSMVSEPEERQIRISVGAAPTGWGPYVTVPWRWDSPADGEPVTTPDDAACEILRRSPFETPEETRAYEHYVEATRLGGDGRRQEALEEMERAVVLAPSDPSYRLVAGLLHLQRLDASRALEHLERGLAHERVPFRRGQILLWASRAADHGGRPERATELRQKLQALDAPYLAPFCQAAEAEARRPIPLRRLRRLQINFVMADAIG